MAAKKAPKNPVTPEHAAQFDDFMRKWQVMFNLADWRVMRSEKPAAKGNMAEMLDFSNEDRMVKYTLGRDWMTTPVTPVSLESTAIHEMLHLRLHGLMHAVADYGVDSEQARQEEHAVIAVFEKLLLRLALFLDAAEAPLVQHAETDI